MAAHRGFTLIETIAVLVIIGISAIIAIPYLITSAERAKAQAAENNLLAISAAQQKYFEDNASYCAATISCMGDVGCVTSGCGYNTADLNNHLRLSISDSFNYLCLTNAGNIPYQCQAQDSIDAIFLDPNAVSPANPITCAGPAGSCPS